MTLGIINIHFRVQNAQFTHIIRIACMTSTDSQTVCPSFFSGKNSYSMKKRTEFSSPAYCFSSRQPSHPCTCSTRALYVLWVLSPRIFKKVFSKVKFSKINNSYCFIKDSGSPEAAAVLKDSGGESPRPGRKAAQAPAVCLPSLFCHQLRCQHGEKGTPLMNTVLTSRTPERVSESPERT